MLIFWNFIWSFTVQKIINCLQIFEERYIMQLHWCKVKVPTYSFRRFLCFAFAERQELCLTDINLCNVCVYCNLYIAGGARFCSGSRDIWDWLWFWVWGGTRREEFFFCFSGVFFYYWQSFHFGGGTGRWAIILWGLDIFLIFPNFLRY